MENILDFQLEISQKKNENVNIFYKEKLICQPKLFFNIILSRFLLQKYFHVSFFLDDETLIIIFFCHENFVHMYCAYLIPKDFTVPTELKHVWLHSS